MPTWNDDLLVTTTGLNVGSQAARVDVFAQNLDISPTGDINLNGFSITNSPDAGNQVVNVKAYGATGDGTTDDISFFIAAQAALPSGGGILFVPPGNYVFKGSGLALNKGVRLIGASKHSTFISNILAGSVPVLISTSSGGGGGQEVSNLQFQVLNSGDICVQLKGVNNSLIQDNRFFFPSSGTGQAIQLDRNSVSGAYTHVVRRNEISNAAIGIELKGGITSSNIIDNSVVATSAITYTSSGNGGNSYHGNLLTPINSGSGTAIGISNGSGGETIFGNYFQNWSIGIAVAATALSSSLGSNHWDNVTTHISDATSGTVGFTGIFDGEDGYLSLGTTSKTRRVNVAGNATGAMPPWFTSIDTQASGKQYSFGSGLSAVGEFALRNDGTGNIPIKVNNADAVTLNAGITATTGAFSASTTIGGGTAITKIKVYTPSLSPSSVSANTTAEQTFSVTGLTTADTVYVNKPTAQAGLGIVGMRVSTADALAITFSNNTGSPITPTATETYRVVAIRS